MSEKVTAADNQINSRNRDLYSSTPDRQIHGNKLVRAGHRNRIIALLYLRATASHPHLENYSCALRLSPERGPSAERLVWLITNY